MSPMNRIIRNALKFITCDTDASRDIADSPGASGLVKVTGGDKITLSPPSYEPLWI